MKTILYTLLFFFGLMMAANDPAEMSGFVINLAGLAIITFSAYKINKEQAHGDE